MRICVIEAADFRSAIDQLDAGVPESYQAQTYSTSFIRNLSDKAETLSLIGTKAGSPSHERRGNVDFYTMEYWAAGGPAHLAEALRASRPTHLILRVPLRQALDHAHGQPIATAVMLADSFSVRGWSPRAVKRRLNYRRLAMALNRPHVALVGNHNKAACRDLVRIGVRKEKVIPWEWPTPRTPDQYPAKTFPTDRPRQLLFVGAWVETKGVLDLIDMLAEPGMTDAHLSFIGKGDAAALSARIATKGVGDRVHLIGTLPNAEVFTRMQQADVVLVPSHHAYAEGLPKTIREALTVRTPVVMSDHPMFWGYFSGDKGAVMVPEKSPAALALAVKHVTQDAATYAAHSLATATAFADIDCPNKWADILDHWLRGDPEGYLSQRLGAWA